MPRHVPVAMPVKREAFGRLSDGQAVDVFTVAGTGGLELRVMTYGATVVSLRAPDAGGRPDDVVLGFDSVAGYEASRFFGTVVGRYANRIAQARFTLDGRTYALTANTPPHHLHGGARGFHRAVWSGEAAREGAVRFRLVSPDGDEGYPGRVEAEVTYTVTSGNEVFIDYAATTDRPTPINLSQHAYFNLAGAQAVDILSHELTLYADHFLPVDATMIPTGEQAEVAGTPFDFRDPHRVGARIDADHEQLRRAKGYDHTFVVRRTGAGLARTARLLDPVTGRRLEVHTTEPGVQFYSGNHLRGAAGRGGRTYGPRAGLCLETQHFPDSPNRPEFPSAIVRPPDEYRSRTIWSLGVA